MKCIVCGKRIEICDECSRFLKKNYSDPSDRSEAMKIFREAAKEGGDE